jgi:hypothetical protein
MNQNLIERCSTKINKFQLNYPILQCFKDSIEKSNFTMFPSLNKKVQFYHVTVQLGSVSVSFAAVGTDVRLKKKLDILTHKEISYYSTSICQR